MDHPNIAKVLDAGEAEGRPYFVMELIKCVPITDYCDRARLLPRERLALFVPVCEAVQHAHQKGVVHRDLKLSNILVALDDGRPAPKVVDFGIAKATGPRLTDRSIYTEVGALVGTLTASKTQAAEQQVNKRVRPQEECKPIRVGSVSARAMRREITTTHVCQSRPQRSSVLSQLGGAGSTRIRQRDRLLCVLVLLPAEGMQNSGYISQDRTKAMIACLTEGVRRRQFATNSPSAPSTLPISQFKSVATEFPAIIRRQPVLDADEPDERSVSSG
jgi:serine/threonine protein kinase